MKASTDKNETQVESPVAQPSAALTAPGLGLTVDIVVFGIRPNAEGERSLEVLLIRRPRPPFAGCWALPGGFVRPDESLTEAAARVLNAKTGLRSTYLEQLYTFGSPNRDPRRRVVTAAHYAVIRIDEVEAYVQSSDDVQWWPVNKLPTPLAFDHEAIIDYALWRLRNKVSYAHIAFQFLPPTFTLAQLRAVYEVILGRRLDPTNFRRHVEATGTIVPTEERLAGGRHRPPRLYRCAVEPNALYQGPAA